MTPKASKTSLATRVIHADQPIERFEGAAVTPIFQVSVLEQPEEVDYNDIRYPRLNNLPNHVILGQKLASLEGSEAALVTSSGMSAISTAVLQTLLPGGHLLSQRDLYGGTLGFFTQDLPALGMAVDFIDANDPDSWAAMLQPNTRAIYTEALTNPLLQLADHHAITRFAKEHGLVSIIDNTFPSPINFRPLEHGYDLVVHSATKYLNGHSDLVAGVVAGTNERVQAITHLLNHFGGCLPPHACFLLDRGLKTLALRIRQQNENALAIASFLHEHPQVEAVHYPGLPSHPHHERARELFDGFGGMLSFSLQGGAPAAKQLFQALKLPLHAPSLGGVETLISRPAALSHAGMPQAERESLGISDGLIRLSAGIEATEDLLQDFSQALTTLT